MNAPSRPRRILAGPLALVVDAAARRLRRPLPRAAPDQLPTVAVHGLALGGAGKTPVCLWLARRLAERVGGAVAVGTRPRSVVGDEAALFDRSLPGAPVFPAARPAEAIAAATAAGCRAIVLDDPSLSRAAPAHARIVCLGPGDDWTMPAFPAGDRRPACVRPDEADQLVLVDRPLPPAGLSLPVVRARTVAVDIRPLDLPAGGPSGPRGLSFPGTPGTPATPAEGLRVYVLCAVARPERVVRSVESLGATVVGTRFLRDHARLTPAVCAAATRAAGRRRAHAIVVTEKDAARMGWPEATSASGSASGRRAGPAWAVLRVALELDDGSALLDAIGRAAGI